MFWYGARGNENDKDLIIHGEKVKAVKVDEARKK